MKKTILSGIAISTAILLCMSLFGGMPVLADNNTIVDPGADASVKVNADKHKHYLEEAIIKLVQEGKLSKEKAEKIFEYKKKKTEELSKLTKEQRHQLKKQGKYGSLLMELKKNGIISDKEAQLIKSKLHEMKAARMNEGLQGLVDKGVLTSKDIENMRSYMLKVREERKERIEKLKNMTPDERKAYFTEHKRDHKDILTRMVEDKVITAEQAEEIRKAVPELGKQRFKTNKDNHKLQ